MSDRIKELVKQATIKVPSKMMNPDTFEVEPFIRNGEQMFHDVFDKEKFAELIVAKCLDLCKAVSGEDAFIEENSLEDGARAARRNIQEHFGFRK